MQPWEGPSQHAAFPFSLQTASKRCWQGMTGSQRGGKLQHIYSFFTVYMRLHG